MLPEKAIDVPIGPKPVHPLPVLTRIQSQLGPIATRQSVLEHGHPVEEDGAEVKLSQGRKWALLVIFSLALFVDGQSASALKGEIPHRCDICSIEHADAPLIVVVGSSAFFVFTGVVAPDLDIVFEQQSWVIVSGSGIGDSSADSVQDLIHSHLLIISPLRECLARISSEH
jgi:hypothetical protein